MYTHHPLPGKYERNTSQLIAEIVYAAASDGASKEWDFGRGDGHMDWNGLIEGKRFSFIVHNNDHGFVDVAIYDRSNWDELLDLGLAIRELDQTLAAFWPAEKIP